MKRSIILILLVWSSFVSFSQSFYDKHGKGRVVFAFEKYATLNFYNQPIDLNPTLTISVAEDADNQQLYLKLTDEQKSWFTPDYFWNEEKIVHFKCLKREGNWFLVEVEKKTQKTFWIQDNKNLHYYSWRRYLPNTTGIEIINSDENTPKIFKSKLSPKFTKSPNECMRIVKIHKKWAKLEFDHRNCFGHTSEFKKSKYAWIKWRDESDFKIRYYFK